MDGDNYLLIACDRHQQLRLLGTQATILRGLISKGIQRRYDELSLAISRLHCRPRADVSVVRDVGTKDHPK